MTNGKITARGTHRLALNDCEKHRRRDHQRGDCQSGPGRVSLSHVGAPEVCQANSKRSV